MTEQKSPEQLQAEIEAQRQQLASTVDDLAAKLDVKSQAQHKVAEIKDSATTAEGKPRPEVIAAAAIVVVGLGLVLWRRRR